jgi:hypothetical protein
VEKQILFREYQEQQAQDHIDLQDFARESFDHLVNDAVTSTRRYAGFNVIKSAQTEVQVATGRFYDSDGAVYHRDTTLTQSMLTYLPAVASRIVTLTTYGNETETEVEERDFLVDVDTGRTEPEAVATVSSRDAVLSFVQGTESADPQPPAVPVGSVAICNILLDPTSVVSVTMLTDNDVASLEELDERVEDVEDFNDIIGPRVSSLASDLAALAEALKRKGSGYDIGQIYQDMARVKERVEIPAIAVDYGADRFLDETDSDTDDTQTLGYDAMVQEGCRFAWANDDVFEPNIFSANDPNASLTSGLLLPAFDSVLKMEIGPYNEDLGISQFGFQTHDIVQKQIARQRIRYGEWFQMCTNATWWRAGAYDQITRTFLKGGETYEVANVEHEAIENAGLTHWVRVRQFWKDTYVENYWDVLTVDHQITGAQVAQTVLVANDMWLTKVGFYLTAKAANEAVYITITKITTGMPDLEKAILHQQIAHTSLVVGGWTEVSVMPTFLKGGERYAIVFTSNANHKIGMAYGQQYLDGTFFTSTDTEYFLGDLMKDMMIRLYGAKFRSPQVTIELTALNLDGGIQNIDILAGIIEPESTKLIFEVQPGGSGEWKPIDPSDITAFSGGAPPVLCRFRARFVGTRDMHAGFLLTGSEIRLFRPKTAFMHISERQTLSGPSGEVHVKVLLENFNDVAHDLSCKLYFESGLDFDPVLTTDVAINSTSISREFKFTPTSPELSEFTIELIGATNSSSNTFHVAERIHWAL